MYAEDAGMSYRLAAPAQDVVEALAKSRCRGLVPGNQGRRGRIGCQCSTPRPRHWSRDGPHGYRSRVVSGRLRRRRIVDVEIMLRVDGTEHRLAVDTRTTLLDALRERLQVTATCHPAGEPQRSILPAVGRVAPSYSALRPQAAVASADRESVFSQRFSGSSGRSPPARRRLRPAARRVPRDWDL